MPEIRAADDGSPLDRIRAQAASGTVRLTQHAHQEMVDENITLAELLEALDTGEVLEDYPEHRRGPCCLLNGRTHGGRPLHIVCTTTVSVLIIITAYEPKLPKWMTPTQRRQLS
jgi:uncharacterized protein DUF4258